MKALASTVFGDAGDGESPFALDLRTNSTGAFAGCRPGEAWRVHGAWITSGKPRTLGPGVEERFGFGRAVDDNTAHAEKVRRHAFRAELSALLGKDGFLVLPTVPGAGAD